MNRATRSLLGDGEDVLPSGSSLGGGIAASELWAARGTPDDFEETDAGVVSSSDVDGPADDSDAFALLTMSRESLLDRVRASLNITLRKNTLGASVLRGVRMDLEGMTVTPTTTRLRTVLECEIPMVLQLPIEDEALEIITQAIGDAYAAGFRPGYRFASIKHFTRIMPFWIVSKADIFTGVPEMKAVAITSSQFVDDMFLVVTVRLHCRSLHEAIMCWSTSLLKLTPPEVPEAADESPDDRPGGPLDNDS